MMARGQWGESPWKEWRDQPNEPGPGSDLVLFEALARCYGAPNPGETADRVMAKVRGAKRSREAALRILELLRDESTEG